MKSCELAMLFVDRGFVVGLEKSSSCCLELVEAGHGSAVEIWFDTSAEPAEPLLSRVTVLLK